jgi:hypothetical protein
MDNNLEILCFERFPDLHQLTKFNIRNNSLINLDVPELKKKVPSLKKIATTGNKWSCDYYELTLTIALKESNVTEISNFTPKSEKKCLTVEDMLKVAESKVKICPRMDEIVKTKNETAFMLLFWIYLAVISIGCLFEIFEIWYFAMQ